MRTPTGTCVMDELTENGREMDKVGRLCKGKQIVQQKEYSRPLKQIEGAVVEPSTPEPERMWYG